MPKPRKYRNYMFKYKVYLHQNNIDHQLSRIHCLTMCKWLFSQTSIDSFAKRFFSKYKYWVSMGIHSVKLVDISREVCKANKRKLKWTGAVLPFLRLNLICYCYISFCSGNFLRVQSSVMLSPKNDFCVKRRYIRMRYFHGVWTKIRPTVPCHDFLVPSYFHLPVVQNWLVVNEYSANGWILLYTMYTITYCVWT